MELNEFVCSMGCFAKLEVWLFVINAFLYSLNLTLNPLLFARTRFIAVGACQFIYPELCVSLIPVFLPL